MNRVKISVVIPLYNKERHIERSIASVFRQTRLPDEVIVVDDGSTDRSVEFLSSWLTRNGFEGGLKLIRCNNQGVSAARNTGVYASTGNYIAFLDADDEWDESYLEVMLGAIEGGFGEGFYSCAHVELKGRSEEKRLAPQLAVPREYDKQKFYCEMSRRSLVNSSKVIVQKDLLLQIGGFPAGIKYGEDLHVWICLIEVVNLCFVDSVLVYINQDFDEHRKIRNRFVLYPLEYYSEKGRAEKPLAKYLSSLFHRSLLVKLCEGSYGAAYRTIQAFSKIKGVRFKLYIAFLLLPPFVYRAIYKLIKAI